MTDNRLNTDFQFSLQALMILITVACIVLAFPGGYLLVGVFATWVLLVGAITCVLVRFRAPIYRVLSGVKPDEKGE